jgi:hypothetical protein
MKRIRNAKQIAIGCLQIPSHSNMFHVLDDAKGIKIVKALKASGESDGLEENTIAVFCLLNGPLVAVILFVVFFCDHVAVGIAGQDIGMVSPGCDD